MSNNQFQGCPFTEDIIFPPVPTYNNSFFQQINYKSNSAVDYKSYTFTEGTTTLGSYLFAWSKPDNRSAITLNLPSTLTQVSGGMLYAKTQINVVNCYCETPPTVIPSSNYGSKVFNNTTHPSISLHVPEGCQEAYENTDWYTDGVTITPDLKVENSPKWETWTPSQYNTFFEEQGWTLRVDDDYVPYEPSEN